MVRRNPIPSGIHAKLLDSLRMALVYVTPDLRIEYLNPAAEILLGTSARQVTGLNLQDLLPEQDPLLDHALAVLEQREGVAEWEATLNIANRKTVTVDLTISPIEQKNGCHLLIEMQAVDRHIRAYREEAQREQHHLSREVIRGLAHEIKNPLGGLRGAAQLLARQLDDESLQEYTNIIKAEADRLRDLVDRLLGPSDRMQKVEHNIHEILEYVRQLLEAELEDSEIIVVRDYDPSIPMVVIDRQQIIQAVLNVARNAAQALPEGGQITLRTRTARQITVGSQRVRLAAKIEIEDNGAGIPPELQDKVFYPMVTGREEGTGLGLPIAQNILAQHGGVIEHSSEPGKTVFSLIIPLELAREQ